MLIMKLNWVGLGTISIHVATKQARNHLCSWQLCVWYDFWNIEKNVLLCLHISGQFFPPHLFIDVSNSFYGSFWEIVRLKNRVRYFKCKSLQRRQSSELHSHFLTDNLSFFKTVLMECAKVLDAQGGEKHVENGTWGPNLHRNLSVLTWTGSLDRKNTFPCFRIKDKPLL